MAIYKIDIEKSTSPTSGSTVYWTNVYHVNAPDLANAITVGNSIVTLEKTIHASSVNFTKMRVQNTSVLAQAGTIVPLSGAGGRSVTNAAPLFNVFRVDFAVSSGRPSRKYLRGPVATADITNGALQSAIVTSIQNNYITPLINTGVMTDPQGQGFVSGAVFPSVGMRQLRRGSKRKTTPVI